MGIKKIARRQRELIKEGAEVEVSKKIIGSVIGGVMMLVSMIAGIGWGLLNPEYEGEIVEIKYEPYLELENKGKFIIHGERGMGDCQIFSYQGDVRIVLEGKGKIKKAYLLYGEESNDVTDGDSYRMSVDKKRSGQYILSGGVRFQTLYPIKNRLMYLVVEGKRGNREIYCLSVDLESIPATYVLKLEELEDSGFVVRRTFNQSFPPDIRVEIKSEEDIQYLRNNERNSEIANERKEVLSTINRIKKYDFD